MGDVDDLNTSSCSVVRSSREGEVVEQTQTSCSEFGHKGKERNGLKAAGGSG